MVSKTAIGCTRWGRGFVSPMFRKEEENGKEARRSHSESGLELLYMKVMERKCPMTSGPSSKPVRSLMSVLRRRIVPDNPIGQLSSFQPVSTVDIVASVSKWSYSFQEVHMSLTFLTWQLCRSPLSGTSFTMAIFLQSNLRLYISFSWHSFLSTYPCLKKIHPERLYCTQHEFLYMLQSMSFEQTWTCKHIPLSG